MTSLLEQIGAWSCRHWGSVVQMGVVCAVYLFSSVSVAGDLTELSVKEADGTFTLRIVSVLDAPMDYVYQVITDYQHAYRIDPEITAIEVLPSGRPGVVRVRNLSTHWIGPFPFKLEWVGEIAETEPGYLDITTLSGLGSFESGSAFWEIRPQGDRTRVLHQSTLKPRFPVIPIIGSYILKTHIKRAALDTFNRIECQAQYMLEQGIKANSQSLRGTLKEIQDCIPSRKHEIDQVATQ
jgi:Polyketide cyclase / dehydrase and lipid transport